MRILFTICLLSSLYSRAQTEYYNSEESNFTASELILGKWFLDKVEIIGLNNNDSTTIVSKENGKTSLVFTEERVKTYHDTTEYSYYKPSSYEFHYDISFDSITKWSELHLLSKRKKETFESFVLVSISFEQLVYETFDSGIGLEKKQSRTRYFFTKHPGVENPFVGKWNIVQKYSPANYDRKDSLYNFIRALDSTESSIEQNESRTIDFWKPGYYSFTSFNGLSGYAIVGTYLIDLTRKKILFDSNETIVYTYSLNLDGTLNLEYDPMLTKHYSK
jgi:hypothetical protein